MVLLGDSLFQFYNWQQRFPGLLVVNRGIAGETVKGLLARITAELTHIENKDVVMFMIGANNIVMEDYGFVGDYQSMLTKFRREKPCCRLVVTSLIPFRLPWLSPDAIFRINNLLRKTAGQWGADYLDIHVRLVAGESGEERCFLEDGVHLSERGYRIWTNEVERYLSTFTEG
ncbi:MAG: GDSL-type esterase/lipase family protein [Pseudomonadota bacterium]